MARTNKHLVKIGRVVSEICSLTDSNTQADMFTTIFQNAAVDWRIDTGVNNLTSTGHVEDAL